jgi:zinc transporter ZupT
MSSPQLGITIALAIAIHNIPGMLVRMTLLLVMRHQSESLLALALPNANQAG